MIVRHEAWLCPTPAFWISCISLQLLQKLQKVKQWQEDEAPGGRACRWAEAGI